MVRKLFRYKLKMKNGQFREGLILQNGRGLGEIAPLPGFSKESLIEAEKETLQWIHEKKEPKLPSVQWGIASTYRPLNSVRLPLCALGPKQGFPANKLKLGDLSVPEAIDFVKKQNGILRLDCNRKWSLEQALEFTSHFKPNDFAYIEEPTSNLTAFSKKTKFPIAIDESIDMDWTQLPTLVAIVVKPTIVGSIPKIPPHLDLVLSSSYESGLGLLHIANCATLNIPIGLDTYDALEEDLLINPIRIEKGQFIWEKTDPIIDFSKLCLAH